MELPRTSDPTRLSRSKAQLLIVDVQQRLLPHIHGHETVLVEIERLLRAAAVLALPVTVSEQYPQGLGPTARALIDAAQAAARMSKLTFSVCGDDAALAHLRSSDRPQVLLAGIETHVCVQQTALDLLICGLTPVVLADAVGSRRAFDRDIALERMRAAGVIVTTVESAIFELTQRCDTGLFRQILKIVK